MESARRARRVEGAMRTLKTFAAALLFGFAVIGCALALFLIGLLL